jgi:hypothetical protein
LSEKFPQKALREAGLAKTAPKRQIVLNDLLTQPESLFLVLHDAKSRLPVEILTQCGILGSHTLPRFTALERGDTVAVEGWNGRHLFLVGTTGRLLNFFSAAWRIGKARHAVCYEPWRYASLVDFGCHFDRTAASPRNALALRLCVTLRFGNSTVKTLNDAPLWRKSG